MCVFYLQAEQDCVQSGLGLGLQVCWPDPGSQLGCGGRDRDWQDTGWGWKDESGSLKPPDPNSFPTKYHFPFMLLSSVNLLQPTAAAIGRAKTTEFRNLLICAWIYWVCNIKYYAPYWLSFYLRWGPLHLSPALPCGLVKYVKKLVPSIVIIVLFETPVSVYHVISSLEKKKKHLVCPSRPLEPYLPVGTALTATP